MSDVVISVKKKTFVLAVLLIVGIAISVAFYLYLPFQEITGMAVQEMKIIREPAVAGEFYSSDKNTLENSINSHLNLAKQGDVKNLKALVSPHAGYIYSGPVAAYGFDLLKNKNYKTIIILGPTHYVPFTGVSIANYSHYRTPLGLVKLSEKINELKKESFFVSNNFIHRNEHSVEVQIPFLQVVLSDFEIIPIVVGNVDSEEIADILIKYIDDETLIIASSDLSHYYSYGEAVNKDKNCIHSIPNLDFLEMEKCEACGKLPILILMNIAKKLDWKGKLLDYRNSGDTQGNKEKVVGYASIAFYEEELTNEEKEFLLSLAKDNLNSYLKDGKEVSVDESKLTTKLRKIQGCFVTLNKNYNLRGCIGHILPQEELYKCVIDNSINAALHDSRFNPVDYIELKDLEVEISVLSVPKELKFSSPQELLEKLVPLRDGIIIQYHGHQSTYLPQVWENFKSKEEFLGSLCDKGGSSYYCWKEPDVKIFTYYANVFDESLLHN